uniref:Erythropoietin receptor PROTEIN n=1 Tax=Podoviridae sp. ctWeH21 TaxID=2825255 RepID=A0A8S5PHB9_9CAUD|nr:MAG TPA: Erythropoietin receptor PROTEIN [Podoviridae sp. ctWeH21]
MNIILLSVLFLFICLFSLFCICLLSNRQFVDH